MLDGFFWGSCTVEDDWDTGRFRHMMTPEELRPERRLSKGAR